MSTTSLPANPHLDQLRAQARALQHALQSGDATAMDRVRQQYTLKRGQNPSTLGLATAQLVVAREYGFASWPRLKQYVELVTDYRWDISPGDPDEAPADQFCRLVCLTYHDDDPARWGRARAMLAADPGLADEHIWAAAAAFDSASVDRLLAARPELGRTRGGPYGWTPLFYLAYSRAVGTTDDTTAIARRLLELGADPNEGYLWNGQLYAFTVLTGVFGEGELGPARQPRHPHALTLARMLLEAGANPNDSQALYNRMFGADDDHLELLFEFGLGTGDGGPWYRRASEPFMGAEQPTHRYAGSPLESPEALLRGQLRWAIEHNFGERVQLLSEHGVDIHTAFDDGLIPLAVAELNGNPTVADHLRSCGAAPVTLDPTGELVAALLRGDADAVWQLADTHPEAVEEARRTRPGLMVWAAATGRTTAVSLLADLGFDVNAPGRGDVPQETDADIGATALHQAAARGDVEMAELLLARGADPAIKDTTFDATPLGWAEHFDQQTMIELLR